MITVRNGYVRIPMPSLEAVCRVIRAIRTTNSETSLEMKFRKSNLYDLLKGKNAASGSTYDDAVLLVNLWLNKPGYLSAVIGMNAENSREIVFYSDTNTVDGAANFAHHFLSQNIDTFRANENIVAFLVDVYRIPMARAAYFGAFVDGISGKDLTAFKTLELSPEEVFVYKTKGMIITNPQGIKDDYLAIKTATGSAESVLFASIGFNTKLSIEVINHEISFMSFMDILRRGDSMRELSIMFEYTIDPFLMKALNDAESLGYATEGFVLMGLSNAA
jgi:hypothetical protein